jgi:hypothetical protein
MSRCALLGTASAIFTVALLPASAAHAQVRAAAPVPPRPVAPVVSPPPIGAAPYAVYFKKTETTTGKTDTKEGGAPEYVMLGNATAVVFHIVPSEATTKERGPLSTVVIHFAGNDQQAQAISQTSCLATGCKDRTLLIRYTTPQGTTLYTMKDIVLAELQAGTFPVATFSFAEYLVQTGK